MLWDVFISHASEDKSTVATPLADALTRRGLKVWLDQAELALGDSLREKIDPGLANTRFGVIILSPRFFAKDWPKRELNGLVAKEIGGVKVILPVWHEVDHAAVARHSPTLADRLAAKTSEGIEAVAAMIVHVVTSGSRSETLPEPPLVQAEVPGHTNRQDDLLVDVSCDDHFFAVCIRNEDTHPVSDGRVTLERLDRFLPKKQDFAFNSFEAMTLVHARVIRGGEPSDGFAFATWDSGYRSMTFQSGIPEHRKSERPEIKAEGMWIAEFQLTCGGKPVSREPRFFQFVPGTKPSLISDPRKSAASPIAPPPLRFAHLKNQHVRLTPVLPLSLGDKEYFVRNVTADEIELGRDGFVISIPAQKIIGNFPVPQRPEVRVLELDGRMQWLTVPRSWQYFSEKPTSNEERQYGFRRAIADSDPMINTLQSRGQTIRFASPDNLPRYFHEGYQLVYDDQGYYLGRRNAVLIVKGA